MLYSMRINHRDGFDMLQQSSVLIFDYEARFHTLSKYALSSIPTEFKRIRRFTKGFIGYL